MRRAPGGLVLAVCLVGMAAAPAWAKTWTVASASNFGAGKMDGVSVLSTGEVQLAPEAQKIEGIEAELVWDIEPMTGGGFCVGTGSPGGVFTVTDGALKQLYSDEKQQVFSVLGLPDGSVLAALAPDGYIVRISRHGEVEPFAKLEDGYIWDMAAGPGSSVYCATGPNGRLWRFDMSGNGTEVLKVEQTHLMCVAVDGQGMIYVGTAPDGYVYQVRPGGRATLLFDADEGEVHDLIIAPDGSLYACTAQGEARAQRPSGDDETPPARPMRAQGAGSSAPGAENSIYRIRPDEGAATVARLGRAFVLGLAMFGDTLLAGTGPGGRLMGVREDGVQAILHQFDAAHVQAVAVSESGEALIGTSNAAGLWLMTRHHAAKGTLTSKPFDAGYLSRWGRLQWVPATEPGEGIRLRMRVGNSAEPDQYWSDWSDWATDPSGTALDLPLGQFAQFEAELTAHPRLGSPTLLEVDVSYRQTNRKPAIEDVKLDGESLLHAEPAGPQPVRPPLRRPTPMPQRPTQSSPRGKARTVEWEASDPNEDDLAFDLYYRADDEHDWKVLEEDIREGNSFEWDASRVPDGHYRLRLVARDDPARPEGEALADERVTPSFIVDNTAPLFAELRARRLATGVYEIAGRAEDGLSPIAEIRVSRNAGDWQTVHPSDGLFDSPAEDFVYRCEPLEPGEYVFVFSATDAADNPGSARVVVTVPGGE